MELMALSLFQHYSCLVSYVVALCIVDDGFLDGGFALYQDIYTACNICTTCYPSRCGLVHCFRSLLVSVRYT